MRRAARGKSERNSNFEHFRIQNDQRALHGLRVSFIDAASDRAEASDP